MVFAVNVTLTPEQIVAADGLLVMLIVGVAEEFTVIVTALLVATAGNAQVSDEVISHVTLCPFASVELVYVALFVPTGEPSTNH